ncbi:glycosyltransferase family A protein [Glycomyces sp. NPDC047010]|uniref:glycosyltransferase family 2 protein n=1 Tax=Glycomyces sp. NPDC047010 TaxID=3155023 RepID=UPI0033D62AAE
MHERQEGVSVIVPCRNAGRYLAEAIDSLCAQPWAGPWEAIVVDDASDDPATLLDLEQLRTTSNVRVLQLPEHCGVQTARNTGLAAAAFAYTMQLDADDRLATDPGLLADGTYPDRAVALLRADPGMAFVHTMAHMFGAATGYTISSYPCTEALIATKHHAPISLVCRTSQALAAAYNPAVRKWQDWAFAIALLAERARHGRPNRIGCIPGPFYDYRIHHRPGRLSQTAISEHAATAPVVESHLTYFQRFHGAGRDADTITADLIAAKPDRLTDLLHMAAFDLPQALTLARQRQYQLTGCWDELGIP